MRERKLFFWGEKERYIEKEGGEEEEGRKSGEKFFPRVIYTHCTGEKWCSSKSMYTKSIYDFVPHLDLD